jgi:hypothetical protein
VSKGWFLQLGDVGCRNESYDIAWECRVHLSNIKYLHLSERFVYLLDRWLLLVDLSYNIDFRNRLVAVVVIILLQLFLLFLFELTLLGFRLAATVLLLTER